MALHIYIYKFFVFLLISANELILITTSFRGHWLLIELRQTCHWFALNIVKRETSNFECLKWPHHIVGVRTKSPFFLN